MFKVKRIDSGKIYTVLSVHFDDTYHQAYFFIWENNGWRWRPADKFIPPAVDTDKYLEIINKVPF